MHDKKSELIAERRQLFIYGRMRGIRRAPARIDNRKSPKQEYQ